MGTRPQTLIEHEGKTTTFQALAKATGLNYQTLYTRWKVGKRGEELTKKPSERASKKTLEG